MPFDIESAENKYRKAADEGDPVAQLNLADAYFSSARMTHNYTINLRWMGKSSERQTSDESSMLVDHQLKTLDQYATRDLTQAYKWYTLSMLQDDLGSNTKTAKSRRDELSNHMTPEQIIESERQIQTWLANTRKQNEALE